MDFIFDNIFIVIVVVVAVINLFSSITKSKLKTNERDAQAKQAQAQPVDRREPSQSSSSSDLFGELKDLFKEVSETMTDEPSAKKATQTSQASNDVELASAKAMASAEATHEDQMDQWRKRYTTASAKEAKVKHRLVGDLPDVDETAGKYSSGVEDTDVKKHLTRRGLQESLVMAEILGPPRAFKPHQSSYRRRNI